MYTLLKGGRYEGWFLNDLYHGHGNESWVDGAKYDGEYFEGEK